MTGFFIFLHILCTIFLVTVILMQSGRGGGLTEGFASAESMFGAKTNAFMVKSTAVLAGVFLVTSLVLAFLSSRTDKSLIPEAVQTQAQTSPVPAGGSEPAVPEPSLPE